MTNVIVAERLTKSYGRKRGVIDLDFAVPPGKVFGYLGPNGVGKTTTIRTMLDLIRLTSGRVTVFGLDPRRESQDIHRRIGYLPGELACTTGSRAASISLTSPRSAAGSTRSTPCGICAGSNGAQRVSPPLASILGATARIISSVDRSMCEEAERVLPGPGQDRIEGSAIRGRRGRRSRRTAQERRTRGQRSPRRSLPIA